MLNLKEGDFFMLKGCDGGGFTVEKGNKTVYNYTTGSSGMLWPLADEHRIHNIKRKQSLIKYKN